MKLSSKTRYSLRIMIQIILDTEDNRAVKGREIAKQQHISEAYLEQIMMPLKSAGLVNTIRGCRGGYSLAKAPDNITVLDIIELFEGKVEFADCKHEGKHCQMLDRCFTAEIWDNLSKALGEAAKKITLASIIEKHVNQTSKEYII